MPTILRSGPLHLFAAALCCCLAACTTTTTPDDAGPVTAANYQARSKAAFCAYATRCLPMFQYEACGPVSPGDANFDFAKQVTAGRMTFNATLAAACLADIAALSCTDAFTSSGKLNTDCSGASVAATAAGKPCDRDDECIDGVCRTEGQCPMLCETLKKFGEHCDAHVGCTKGNFCDSDGTESTCKAAQANGAPCSSSNACTSEFCDYSQQPAVCAAAPTGSLAAGAACSSASQCLSGHYCKGATGTGVGVCTAQVAKGAACGANDDVDSIQSGCAGGISCTGGSVTTSASGFSTVAGTCTTPSNVGGACVQAKAGAAYAVTGCMSGLACGADSKCATYPTTGPCAERRCGDGAFCDDNNTCHLQGENGAMCVGGDECKSSRCSGDGVCEASTDCPAL